METVLALLVDAILSNQTHLRLIEQLEAERIAKETGESFELVQQRMQSMAETILDKVREEYYAKYPELRR